jgi:ribonuclease HI
MEPIEVYALIDENEWKMCIPGGILLEGDREDDDRYRNEVRALMEMLCFLRKYSDQKYIIYTNSSYCVNLCEKWIPRWIDRKFRLPNSEALRPNTDLLVKINSFQSCMEFQLAQHFDAFQKFHEVFGC